MVRYLFPHHFCYGSPFHPLVGVPRLGAGYSKYDLVAAGNTLDGWGAKEFPFEVRVTLKRTREPKGDPKGANREPRHFSIHHLRSRCDT